MKRASLVNLSVLLLVLAFAIAGCTKKPKGPTPIPGTRPAMTTSETPFGPRGSPVTPPGDVTSAPLGIPLPPSEIFEHMNADRQTFSANTVYFDFDRATVKSGERGKVEAVAAHLRQNGEHRLLVEGHCDERGTEEYNAALGERRAQAIREYLINLGISADRVTTTSWGENRPAVNERNDAAYAKNRRGEFVLLTPRTQ